MNYYLVEIKSTSFIPVKADSKEEAVKEAELIAKNVYKDFTTGIVYSDSFREGRIERCEKGQLTLGGLIKLFENVKDKTKPVMFANTEYSPNGFCSWRGSYDELAIEWAKKIVTTQEFLDNLKDELGSEEHGWGGGKYIMQENTLVWIGNYGETSCFTGEHYIAPIDIAEFETCVKIIIKKIEE